MRWRGGHPRFYLPGLYSADLTNGSQIVSTVRTPLQTASDNFLNAMNALIQGPNTFKMHGVRYIQGGNPLPGPISLPVDKLTVHGRVDSQRRRTGREVQ
jgi:hypothetical protein